MNILKIIIVALISIVFYYVSFNIISLFFDSSLKRNIAWGISVYYGYFFFSVPLLISIFACLIKNSIIYFSTIFFTLLVFVNFWIPAFESYPNRVISILVLGFIVYVLVHIYLYLKIHQKTGANIEQVHL